MTKRNLMLVFLVLALVATFCLAACHTEEEVTLVEIKIVSNPTKLTYQEGEKLDLTGLKVNAVYSDETEVDVTDKCTTNLDGKELTAANKSFYVIYSETTAAGNKITKSKMISITVEAEVVINPDCYTDLAPVLADLPHKVVETSASEMLFYTYYDSNSMRCEAVLELTATDASKGTFKFAEISGHEGYGYKMGVITGEYTIKDDKITLQALEVHDVGNTNKYNKATKEVATIVKDGDVITGLNFGKMSDGDKFWGWGKSAASAFVDGMALNYDLTADVAYMAHVSENKLSEGWLTYYEPETIGLYEGTELAATYYVGDVLELPENVAIGVTYKRASEAESKAPYQNCPLNHSFELFILRGTEEIAVTEQLQEGDKLLIKYDGISAEIALNVQPVPVEKTAIRIAVTTAPSKVAYRIGDVFDPTGMVVTVIYSTDETEVLDSVKYTLDISGTEATSVRLTGDATVNVSYQETSESEKLTATQEITASFVEASELAKTSTANYVYAGYIKRNKNQQCYATIELNGDLIDGGTYYVAINFTKTNWSAGFNFAYAGTYTVSEGKVTFSVPTLIAATESQRNTTMFYNDCPKESLNNPSDDYLAARDALTGFVATIDGNNLTFINDGAAVNSFFMFQYAAKPTYTGFYLVEGGVIPSDVATLIEAAQTAMSK